MCADRGEPCSPSGSPSGTFAIGSGDAPSDLPEELGDVYLFAECIVQNSGDVDPLRSKMRQRYGEKGLVELAMAIALARTFPTVKRGLGYASTCDLKGMKVA